MSAVGLTDWPSLTGVCAAPLSIWVEYTRHNAPIRACIASTEIASSRFANSRSISPARRSASFDRSFCRTSFGLAAAFALPLAAGRRTGLAADLAAALGDDIQLVPFF